MKSLLLLIFLLGCGKFIYSPYRVQTQKLNLNATNLARLNRDSILRNDNYQIAVISDTHDYYDELESQVSYINRRGYKMTFLSGDMTNLGMVEEYEQTIKRLRRLRNPYFVTAGNHDLLIDGEKIFRDYFGAMNYSFAIGDSSFIFLNNNNWESKVPAPNLGWLEQELIKHSANKIIIIAHCPHNDDERFSEQEVLRIEALMNDYNVKLFVNGHDHNPVGISPLAKETDKFKAVTVGSSSKRVVLEISVSSEGFTYKHIKI